MTKVDKIPNGTMEVDDYHSSKKERRNTIKLDTEFSGEKTLLEELDTELLVRTLNPTVRECVFKVLYLHIFLLVSSVVYHDIYTNNLGISGITVIRLDCL